MLQLQKKESPDPGLFFFYHLGNNSIPQNADNFEEAVTEAGNKRHWQGRG
ncbi:hypothetical protein [Paenibacillus borealis]|nr:hypothetical protein [Paenibacillus borealis]